MQKFLSLLLVGMVVWTNSAEAATWRVGVAAKEITPTQSLWLCGHIRNRTAEGTLHPLHAKALVIEDEKGNRTAIVTADLIGFTDEMSATISAHVHKRIGLDRERILFNASHTHCGPMLHGYGYAFYGLNMERRADIDKYTHELEDKIVEIVVEAASKLRPADLSYSHDKATFGANRRILKNNRWVDMGVNKEGLADHQVPVLTARAEDGQLIAVLFGYACHNTTLGPGVYRYNGDYAGYAQTAFEKNHPGAVAMFMLGCGADANPVAWNISVPEKAQEFGNDLAAAVDRALAQPQTALTGHLAVAYEIVNLPFAKPRTAAEADEFRKDANPLVQNRGEYLQQYIAKHGSAPQGYPSPLQVIQFGKELSLVALSGETCVGYAMRLEEELDGQRLWVAGYCNDVFGYVPTKQIQKEGGYESMDWYGWTSEFRAGIEDDIIAAAKKLVSQTVEAVAQASKCPASQK